MRLFTLILGLQMAAMAFAQTDVSLFWKKDGKQLTEIKSDKADLTQKLGHAGPAVENSWGAARINVDNNCAIDVYCKQNKGLELRKYQWNSTKQQIDAGAGFGVFDQNVNVGLGGINLLSGNQIVPLEAHNGREIKVVKGDTCSWVEVISRGVLYEGDSLDVAVRIFAYNNSRQFDIEAEVLKGRSRNIRFTTGLNYTDASVRDDDQSHLSVWEPLVRDGVPDSTFVGKSLIFGTQYWMRQRSHKVVGTERLVSILPRKKTRLTILFSSSRDAEINTSDAFFEKAISVKPPKNKKK